MSEKTLIELDKEYAQEAALVGHKAMLISNTQELVEKAQTEIETHLKHMTELRKQINALPPAPPAAEASV